MNENAKEQLALAMGVNNSGWFDSLSNVILNEMLSNDDQVPELTGRQIASALLLNDAPALLQAITGLTADELIEKAEEKCNG